MKILIQHVAFDQRNLAKYHDHSPGKLQRNTSTTATTQTNCKDKQTKVVYAENTRQINHLRVRPVITPLADAQLLLRDPSAGSTTRGEMAAAAFFHMGVTTLDKKDPTAVVSGASDLEGGGMEAAGSGAVDDVRSFRF